MIGHPTEPPGDPQRVTVMAAYDDALASGAAPPDASGAATADDVVLLHLLNQLRQPRPASILDNDAPASGGSPRYLLRGIHAEGGIGQVWLAYDTELGRDVALKVLRPDRAGDPSLEARFLNEARVTGRLQHPGVVPVYELATGGDDDPDDQPAFYAMRLVQGQTLTEAIRAYHARHGARAAAPLERATLLNAFVSVCHTVAYAHARGVIHRDLKPANVTLGDYGEVVVLDWGFAKVLGRPDDLPATGEQPANGCSGPPSAAPADPRQTSAGQVLGTPAYMAPEQADGRSDAISERTDVYGLGAILYELLTGQPPYPGDDAAEVLRQVRSGSPARPGDVAAGVPPALEAVCRKALARDPVDRYPSAAELAREVQHWLADEPVGAYAEPVGTRLLRWARRHPAVVTGTAALVLTGLFAAGLIQVLVRQEQVAAADERAQTAITHANALSRAQGLREVQLYLHRIALAERTLTAHNPGRAIALLEECPSNLRDWEWHCLNRLCHVDAPLLRGHTGTVRAVAFSPDGRTLYSAGFDHTVRVWDVATGRSRPPYLGHDDVVYNLACSPDGRQLASAGWDGTVRLWDTATGQTVRILGEHEVHVEYVTYNADGRTLFTSSNDSVIRVWETTTGELLRSFKPPWRPWCLRASPDGRLLAVGGANGVVRLIDPATWAVVRQLEGHRYPVRAAAFSPDGRLLATGDGDIGRGDAGEVRVWDLTTFRERHTLSGHTDPVLHVAFANNTRLASAGQDHTVKIWDLVTGQEALTLHGHSDMVRCVAFSPDGLRLASAGADHLIRIWDATPWVETQPAHQRLNLAAHNGRALGVTFLPDGRRFASVGADHFIHVWDPDRPEPVQTVNTAAISWANWDCYALAYSPDGARLVTANSSGTIIVLDTNGRLVRTMTGHAAGPIRGLAFRPGSGGPTQPAVFATASWDRTVRVWDLDTGQERLTLNGHTEPVNRVVYSPDGRWLASASNDRTVRIWDADTGGELHALTGHTGGVLGVAVSPDGMLLASAGIDGTIRLWDTATWKERGTAWKGHTSEVRAVAFAPDGRRLASAGHDWTVRLWRVSDGESLAALRGHTDRVHGLAFSPDGGTLASAGYDGAVKLWDVAGLDD